MINDETKYWIALSHIQGWRTKRVNEIIIKFHHEKKISIEEFFSEKDEILLSDYGFTEKETEDLNNAKNELSNFSAIADELDKNDMDVFPITSDDYPVTLKKNLKVGNTPPVIYIRGNKKILKETCVAIVGSRNASEKALQFTDNIAKRFSKEFKVIVSGFAKGVDKQALDSALKYIGQSIIVLPQGILTFYQGFRQYNEQLNEGNLLVLSTFYPKAPWGTDLAMARNQIIYGLADEIYAAESNSKGGTWSGVTDGLKKERVIYVRYPHQSEDNANMTLIEMGAVPVDNNGNVIKEVAKQKKLERKMLNEKIIETLEQKPLTADELIIVLKMDITPRKLQNELKKIEGIIISKNKKGKLLFSL
jgi:predicted Rossmann fold nucleotide-binding protein DprA/Smf involved in DNA uptake